MNALEKYISENCTSEIEAMNSLQMNGIVSDNCVAAAEVSESDQEKAIDFLKAHNAS